MPEANGQSVGNVVVRLDAIFCWSAGWCGRVGGDRLVGGSRDKGCKVARLSDVDRGDSSSDFRRPFLCMLYFVTRFHTTLLCSIGMCKIGCDLGMPSSISRQATEPIIMKQGGRFRRLCPCPIMQPQQAPSSSRKQPFQQLAIKRGRYHARSEGNALTDPAMGTRVNRVMEKGSIGGTMRDECSVLSAGLLKQAKWQFYQLPPLPQQARLSRPCDAPVSLEAQSGTGLVGLDALQPGRQD